MGTGCAASGVGRAVAVGVGSGDALMVNGLVEVEDRSGEQAIATMVIRISPVSCKRRLVDVMIFVFSFEGYSIIRRLRLIALADC